MGCVLWPYTAQAIVSIDQSIAGDRQDGVSHKAHLSFSGASGNTVTSSLTADVLSQWRHGKHLDFLLLQHAYGKSNGATNTDRTFLHLRHRIQLQPVWATEMFAQIGQDTFTRLSNRTLAGGGARLTVMENAGEAAVYLGMGAFYEREQLNAAAGTTDLESKLWRGNFYMVIQAQINAQLMVSSTTYYQPSMQGGADYRLLEEASAKVQVFENIDLKLGLEYSFDSRPPQTVKSDDFRYHTGFEIQF